MARDATRYVHLGGRSPHPVDLGSEKRFAPDTSRRTQIRLLGEGEETNGAIKNQRGLAQRAGFCIQSGIPSPFFLQDFTIGTLRIRTDRKPRHSTPHEKSHAAETARFASETTRLGEKEKPSIQPTSPLPRAIGFRRPLRSLERGSSCCPRRAFQLHVRFSLGTAAPSFDHPVDRKPSRRHLPRRISRRSWRSCL
jgi:hypothetical protein